MHRTLRTRLRLALGAAMVAASLLPTMPVAAGGDGMGCWPNRTNDGHSYLDWSGDNSGLGGGMYAQIFDYSPWVQPGAGGTSAWVMLQHQGDQYTYTQVGWIEWPYGERYTFSQIGWHNGSTFYWNNQNYGALPLGSSYYYTVNYNPYDPNYPYTYYANNTYLGHDGWDIADGQLNMGLVSGEIHTLASQMPGGYAGPSEVWNDIHYWWPRGSSGSWKTFNPTQGFTPGFTNRANYNGGSTVAINDTACPH